MATFKITGVMYEGLLGRGDLLLHMRLTHSVVEEGAWMHQGQIKATGWGLWVPVYHNGFLDM